MRVSSTILPAVLVLLLCVARGRCLLIPSLTQSIKDTIGTAANLTKDVANSTLNIAKDVANYKLDIAKDVTNCTLNIASDVTNSAVNIAKDVTVSKLDIAKDVIDSALNIAEDVTNSKLDIAKDVIDSALNIAEDVTNSKLDIAKDVIDSTLDIAEDVTNSTLDIAEDVTNSTLNLAEDVTNSTLNAAEDVTNLTKEVVGDVQNILTPDDVCYCGLGCFSMSSPWYTALRPLPKPQSPEFIDTKFYLYSRRYPSRYTIVWKCTDAADADADADNIIAFDGAGYDGNKKTFFITHGFASNGNSSWLSDMKDALLKKFDANVFIVDWGKGASQLNYFQVAANTRVVGALLAKLGHLLVDRYNSDPSRMHAIGHSLGAQISAYFAKNMTSLGRLTALDPAQPAFELFDRRVRLDVSDAALVDVVHTSARPFLPFAGLGMVAAYGHLDFYMNGGWNQPGCFWPESINISSFFSLASVPVEVLSNLISCPHGRSYEFFTASLDVNTTFWGHRLRLADSLLSTLTAGYGARVLISDDENCDFDSCTSFGYDAFDFPARGVFSVATTARYPFVVAEPKVENEMRMYRSQQPGTEPTPSSDTQPTSTPSGEEVATSTISEYDNVSDD